MNEMSIDAQGGGLPEGPEIGPPSMGPASRLLNVFFSPGRVFDDIRKSPGGWWLPIAVGAALFAVLAGIHVAKYDQAQIISDKMKGSVFMQLAPADQQDKIIGQAVKAAEATPKWQSQLTYLGWGAFGFTMTVWFLTFLYSLMALMMGWIAEFKASRLFINLGITAGILVVMLVLASILTFIGNAGLRAGTAEAPLAWTAIASLLLAVCATGGVFYTVSRFSRDQPYGRVFSAVAFGLAPGIIASVLGILILFLRTPDATPIEEIVPSSLGALMDAKTSAKWLVSLASSFDLFSLWTIALTSIGLSRALGRKVGEAAVLVLIPWGGWVLLKTAFAALAG